MAGSLKVSESGMVISSKSESESTGAPQLTEIGWLSQVIGKWRV
jgi:hypothetical protein